jgi:uncharacterized protein
VTFALPFDLSLAAALWIGFAIFGASVVRGYSGFGFAALSITAAGLVTDPVNLIPVILIADILLTAQQWPDIRRDVDWRRVGALAAGCVIGAPVGVAVIAQVGPDTARLLISGFILAMCGILWRGWQLRHPPGDLAHGGTGILSGLANGAAVGGLPVAAFFAAQQIPAARFRATLIAYFALMDLMTVPLMIWQGMVTGPTLIATALLLPIMAIGIALGSRQFRRANPAGFRRFAILLLAGLAVAGLIRGLLSSG